MTEIQQRLVLIQWADRALSKLNIALDRGSHVEHLSGSVGI